MLTLGALAIFIISFFLVIYGTPLRLLFVVLPLLRLCCIVGAEKDCSSRDDLNLWSIVNSLLCVCTTLPACTLLLQLHALQETACSSWPLGFCIRLQGHPASLFQSSQLLSELITQVGRRLASYQFGLLNSA